MIAWGKYRHYVVDGVLNRPNGVSDEDWDVFCMRYRDRIPRKVVAGRTGLTQYRITNIEVVVGGAVRREALKARLIPCPYCHGTGYL